MARIVHYLNQFFVGAGGEDAAASPPASQPGPVGPGRRLAQLLGDEHEVVATVSCGDDDAAGRPGAIGEILALVREARPDLVVAGPAFTSGRYGLACARVAAAATAAGIPAVAAMHPDNPGIDEKGAAPVVASGEAARLMGPALDVLSAAVAKVLAGKALTADDGLVGLAPRQPRMADRNAAERAVDLALARLAGDRDATEVPLPRFDKVTPAPPITDLSKSTLAILTEGALVPGDNPGALESARATKWLRYSLAGLDELEPGPWRSVHGGFSTVPSNADPNRILPLDVAR